MRKKVFVRRATADDAANILNCLVTAFEPYRASYTPGAWLDTVLCPATIQQRLSSMQVFVAMSREDAHGAVITGTIACALANAGEGHLRGMAVLPQWQGKKVAEALLQAAEAELAARGCSRITLDTTEPLQRAMHFYENHGYRRSGHISDFFGMPLYEYEKPIS